jgi:isopentenyldiphosphate isomerase
MEIWDILDAEGKKTGRTVQRGTRLRQDEYHLVVHIWVVDLNGNILIQKRAKHLLWMPGRWAVTGGSATCDEESIDAAMRQTSEELGFTLASYKFMKIDRIKSNDQFTDIYFVAGAREEFLPVILGDTVADAFWTSWRGMMEMVLRNEFLHYEYFEMLEKIVCNNDALPV